MRRLWLQIGRSTKGQRATKGGTKCERPSGKCLSHGCQMCVCASVWRGCAQGEAAQKQRSPDEWQLGW